MTAPHVSPSPASPAVPAGPAVLVPEPLPDGAHDEFRHPVVNGGAMNVAAATGAGSAATFAERLAAIDATATRRRAQLAPTNTVKTRRKAWACWQKFLDAAQLPPHPPSNGTLLQFCEWMDSNGLAVSTMKTWVACVVAEARSHYPTPEAGLVGVPKGITAAVFETVNHLGKRAAYAHERRGRGKSLAIHPAAVRDVVSKIDTSRRIGLRNKALALMWYGLGARGAETAHLNIDDVELVVDDYVPGMFLHLRATKTGHRSPFLPFDDVEPQLCPVRAWLAWLDSLREVPHGPAAYPQLTKTGAAKTEALTAEGVHKVLQGLFAAAGQPYRGGHGMRRGHIQHALRRGLAPEDVRNHVGLSPRSDAWYSYLEEWNARQNTTAGGILRLTSDAAPEQPTVP
jgi:hypothetical protein